MATHVIQFPGKVEYGRAITALADVPHTRLGLPNLKMVVVDDHIKALDQAKIPYTDITKDRRNDSATSVQS